MCSDGDLIRCGGVFGSCGVAESRRGEAEEGEGGSGNWLKEDVEAPPGKGGDRAQIEV